MRPPRSARQNPLSLGAQKKAACTAHTQGWHFCLSQLTLTAMLLADVTAQIPIRMFRADTVRLGVCRLCWMPVLLVAYHSIGAQSPVTRTSIGPDSPVTALVNNYCVTCHDSEVKKGGLDLDSISREE